MPAPLLLFSMLLATLYAALCHVIVGGGLQRLVILVIASWIGFGVGQVIGVIAGVDLILVGELRVVASTFGALVALIIVSLLSAERWKQPSAQS